MSDIKNSVAQNTCLKEELHDFQRRLDGVGEMVDVVALDGGYALDLFEVVDGVADVLAFGDADGDAGDDAVVIDELGTIGLDGREQRLLADFLVVHDDQFVRRDVGQGFLYGEGIADGLDALLRSAGHGRREGHQKDDNLFHTHLSCNYCTRTPDQPLQRPWRG